MRRSLTKTRPVYAYVYVSLTKATATEDGSHGDAETSFKKNLYCRPTARSSASVLVARS
jgi:hypothetical protein